MKIKIEIQIRNRRWRWIGHSLRKLTKVIERQVLERNTKCIRRIGRPEGTWRRSINEEEGRTGKRRNEIKFTGNKRVRWKALLVALCISKEGVHFMLQIRSSKPPIG